MRLPVALRGPRRAPAPRVRPSAARAPRARPLASASAEGAAGSEAPKKLWGGRFSEKIDPLMEKFNESLSFDKRLAQEVRTRCAVGFWK